MVYIYIIDPNYHGSRLTLHTKKNTLSLSQYTICTVYLSIHLSVHHSILFYSMLFYLTYLIYLTYLAEIIYNIKIYLSNASNRFINLIY